jgi:peptidyl-prolyl cis-trans isomerase SurA
MRMLRSLPPLAAAVFLFLFLFSPARAEVVDRIVAVVNNDVITQSELDAEALDAYAHINTDVPPEQRQAARAQARAEVLDSMIDKLLITQRAKALKMKVTEEEIDEAMQSVMDRNKITKEQLLANLAQSGVNENIYRNTLRSQLLQNKLISQELRNKVVITEEMARKEYDSHKSETTGDDKQQKSGEQTIYTLQQIGCRWDDIEGRDLPPEVLAQNKEKARKRIEQVHQMAQAGDDFAKLAEQYSDLPSAADHGNLGTLPADELGADTLAAIQGLSDGQISDIIETSNAFQFFKLVKTAREDRQKTEEASVKPDDGFLLVKEQIMNDMYNAEMKKALSNWAQELRDSAYIRKM